MVSGKWSVVSGQLLVVSGQLSLGNNITCSLFPVKSSQLRVPS
ncbi:MAG: hypothetical protein ACKPFD_18395 [Dolichospermum sp.]